MTVTRSPFDRLAILFIQVCLLLAFLFDNLNARASAFLTPSFLRRISTPGHAVIITSMSLDSIASSKQSRHLIPRKGRQHHHYLRSSTGNLAHSLSNIHSIAC